MTKGVLVLSGKGGVGKSLVAANTAIRLREFGYKVGLIDSIPHYSPVIVNYGRRREAELDVLPIGDLFEQVEGPTWQKGNVLYKQPREAIWIYKGYSSNHHQNWTRIKHILRHPYSGPLLRINAVGGLVDVSPNHPMLYRDGRVVEARNLKVGDLIPIPRTWENKGETGVFVGNRDLAWFYGFFMAEGSISMNKSGGYLCSIGNTNKDLLERARAIIQDQLNLPVSNVYEDRRNDRSHTFYKLAFNSKRAYQFFREKFYTSQKQKRVPKEVLNAPVEVKRSFLEGYNDGDGVKGKDVGTFYDSTSQVELAGIATLVACTTGQAFTVYTRPDKPRVIQIRFNKGRDNPLSKRQMVKKIVEMDYKGFLYDIETEDHTFTTGIGPVKVHNSDVSNPNIPQLLGITEGYVDIEMTKEGMRRLVPYRHEGIQVFSSALLSRDKHISFSGQQTSELLRDIVQYGNWDVDVFVVDLPAGLGDELKSSVKVMADILVGSIIVAQPAHIDEAERVVKLHLINEIPVIGLIENMAVMHCPHQGCDEKWHIFGEPRGRQLAEAYGIEFLGEIPLIPNLRQNPILKGEYAKPIQRAAEKILDMKPTRPGFLTRVKEKAKEITREMALDVIATMYKVIIKEVDIRELQETFGYPGGKIIRLNLWDDNFENIIAQADFIVEEGRLKYLNEQEVARRGGPHTRIDAKARALAWAFNGKKRVGDREIPYELVDAWFNGDINIFGSGETIRAIDFMLATWEQMRKVAPEKIMSLVKYLA